MAESKTNAKDINCQHVLQALIYMYCIDLQYNKSSVQFSSVRFSGEFACLYFSAQEDRERASVECWDGVHDSELGLAATSRTVRSEALAEERCRQRY